MVKSRRWTQLTNSPTHSRVLCVPTMHGISFFVPSILQCCPRPRRTNPSSSGRGRREHDKKSRGTTMSRRFFSKTPPPPPPLLRERCTRGYAVTRRQHNIDTAIVYYFHTRMVVAVADDPNPDDDGKSPANPNPSPISSYCRLLLPRFVVDVENNRLPMPPSPKPPPPPS